MNAKRLIITALLAGMALSAMAEQAWITDDLRTGVQDEPTRDAGFAGTLTAGTAVEKLKQSKDGQYTQVRTDDVEGWVLSRNVVDKPSLRARFDEQAQTLRQAQQSLNELQTDGQSVSEQNLKLRKALESSQEQLKKVKNDLLSLQRSSENVVQIDALNRELQDKVAHLEQTNLRLTQQNSRLTDQTQHRELIIGGVLILTGMFVFWLISIFSSARKRSTFNDF